MNYRHAFHAGNFADVVKHIALTAVLVHLRKKETPFAVIDTHAGRGLYDLEGEAALRTGEAANGIGRLIDRGLEDGPSALQTYLEIARAWGRDRYPGSPLIAARLLRPKDRLVAIEKHPDEAAALKAALRPFDRARVMVTDGYAALPALLPPPERRGLILIDPPYESEQDFAAAAASVAIAVRRFATGIALVWFPVKSPAQSDAFCGEILSAGVERALRIDVRIPVSKRDQKNRLGAAGLVVVNPPFGFADDMTAALDIVVPRLEGEGRVVALA